MAASLLIGSLLIALTSTGAPLKLAACSLLTASDIEAVTGVKPGDPHPQEYSAPGTSEPVQTCTWILGAGAQRSQIVISASRLPPGTSATAVAKNNTGMDALRAQHWKEESKDFGNAWCSIMTPPPSIKEPMLMTSCAAGPKGTLLSVVFMSPTQKLSIDQGKALLDKAASRLP